jgi:hypothetical protein
MYLSGFVNSERDYSTKGETVGRKGRKQQDIRIKKHPSSYATAAFAVVA